MTILSNNSKRCFAVVMILIATLIMVGCGGEKTDQQAAGTQEAALEVPSLTPEQQALVDSAAAVALAITKAPETVSKVLAENDLTVDKYQSLIYKISADPSLAMAFEEACGN